MVSIHSRAEDEFVKKIATYKRVWNGLQETVRAVPGIGLTDQNLTMKIGLRESLTTTGATGLKTVLKLQDMGGLGVGMITIVVIERILFVKNTSKNIG